MRVSEGSCSVNCQTRELSFAKEPPNPAHDSQKQISKLKDKIAEKINTERLYPSGQLYLVSLKSQAEFWLSKHNCLKNQAGAHVRAG